MTWRDSSSPRLSGAGHCGPPRTGDLSGPNPIVIGCGAERYHETAVDKGEAGFAFFARLPSKFLPPGIAVPGEYVMGQVTQRYPAFQSLSPDVGSFIRKHKGEGVQGFGKPTQECGND